MPTRAPSLARFVNMTYARTTPPLIFPSSSPRILDSRDGSQQGYSDGMFQFSLALQPLTHKIAHECDLEINRWYADDGTLIGRIEEVSKALCILFTEGPDHHFYQSP